MRRSAKQIEVRSLTNEAKEAFLKSLNSLIQRDSSYVLINRVTDVVLHYYYEDHDKNSQKEKCLVIVDLLKQICSGMPNECPFIVSVFDITVFHHNSRGKVVNDIVDSATSVATLSSGNNSRNYLKKIGNLNYYDFRKCSKSIKELSTSIAEGTKLTLNMWILLLSASAIAGSGFCLNSSLPIVSSMLISPMMNPLTGIVFATATSQYKLLRDGIRCLLYLSLGAFISGFLLTLVIFGHYGVTYDWPTSEMLERTTTASIVVSIPIAAISGLVLAISVTSGELSMYVGIAISSSLLPPLVDCGILIAYAAAFASQQHMEYYYFLAMKALALYLVNVILLWLFGTTIFWFKGINKSTTDANIVALRAAPNFEIVSQIHKSSDNSPTAIDPIRLKPFETSQRGDIPVRIKSIRRPRKYLRQPQIFNLKELIPSNASKTESDNATANETNQLNLNEYINWSHLDSSVNGCQ